jgi:hypothetical protein
MENWFSWIGALFGKGTEDAIHTIVMTVFPALAVLVAVGFYIHALRRHGSAKVIALAISLVDRVPHAATSTAHATSAAAPIRQRS